MKFLNEIDAVFVDKRMMRIAEGGDPLEDASDMSSDTEREMPPLLCSDVVFLSRSRSILVCFEGTIIVQKVQDVPSIGKPHTYNPRKRAPGKLAPIQPLKPQYFNPAHCWLTIEKTGIM